MANVYVDSNAAGAGTGADWANAYTTLAAAYTAKAAGDVFYVAHNHAETQASAMTLTCPGSTATPCETLCVDSAGTVPPVSADLRTTATVTTTGNSAMTFAGVQLVYGITFQCGDGANAAIISWSNVIAYYYFKSCQLAKLGTTASTGAISFGAGTQTLTKYVLDNTTLKFGAAGDAVTIKGAQWSWVNTPDPSIQGTIPTGGLFQMGTGSAAGTTWIEGVDLTALSTNALFLWGSVTRSCVVKNCKVASSAVFTGAISANGATDIYVVNTDSGATNYRHEKYSYVGTHTVETTIVRTGGATDGTTPIAWKIVTTARPRWFIPFECLPMEIWNDTTAANRTVTVYGYWDNAALPKNDEIWIEVSYMGSSATPIATINTANTKADFLATNADQGSDSSTWGGGDTTTRFAMSVTLSSPQPAMKGPIYVTVKVAKASSTFYVDPKIVLS